ncbi:MAG: TetR/AcrR family transcriptional regulator, partial [Oscillospiraceae bacterium]|nr:TetR/AcrR family transcriptional regulator [Oscillospiraceae bacterium]
MGRRKKEPASVHRETIAKAAEQLFARGGFEAATMNDIAKEAGYSKATIYVYFADKEEIVHFLVLKSMKMLYEHISEAVAGQAPAKEKYLGICSALVNYQEQYPFYFTL